MKIKIINRFGVIPNELLNNKSISLKSKGLYAYMQSKPDNWNFSVAGLHTQLKEGRDGITASLLELEKEGWMCRNKFKDEKGMWDVEYHLYSSPRRVSRNGLAVDGEAVNISNKESNKERIRTTATPTLQSLKKKAKDINSDKHFDLETELDKMAKIEGSAEDIMATYFCDKKMNNEKDIPNKKVLEQLKARFYKTAKQLSNYEYEYILSKMEFLEKKFQHEVNIKGEMNATKWTLETVLKEFQK